MILPSKTSYRGHLYVILSTFGFSLVPLLAKFSLDQGMNSETMLTCRFIIAGTFFIVYCLWKNIKLYTSIQTSLKLLSMGLLYALECTCFFQAFKYISPSLGQLLFQVNPMVVAIGAYFFFKERLAKNVLAALLLTGAGCGLLFWEPSSRGTPLGAALVLLAALFYATYVLLGKEALKNIEPMVVTTYTTVGCGVFLLLYSTLSGKLIYTTNPSILGTILVLAIFSTVVSILTFSIGLKYLGATKASILSTLEPVFTVLLACVLMGEKLSLFQQIGGVLIILSILVMEMKFKKGKDSLEKRKDAV